MIKYLPPPSRAEYSSSEATRIRLIPRSIKSQPTNLSLNHKWNQGVSEGHTPLTDSFYDGNTDNVNILCHILRDRAESLG